MSFPNRTPINKQDINQDLSYPTFALEGLNLSKQSEPTVSGIPAEKNYEIPTDRNSGILNRQPVNTNYSFASNFYLSIPKIRLGTYFCTEVGFPEMTCEAVRLQVPFAPSLKFFGDKVTHGDLTVKFIVNEDYSNYNQMGDWFKKTLVYEDFFKTGTDLGFSALTNIGHLLILSNKKNPVARFRFNGLFITNLTSIEYNSALTDASIATATATFQFSSYDLDEI